MRIGVCFKIVPDYEGLLPEEWRDPGNLDFTYVKKQYSFFDEAALEMALQIADGCKAADVAVETVAVTCGAPSGAVSDGLLRALFAAGFHDVALLPAGEAFSPADTARLLASYFVKHPADLILTGRMAGPGDSGMAPFYLAKALEMPLFTELTAARYDKDACGIEITCKSASAEKVYGLQGAAVGTVGDAEAAYLRLFPLKARMEAKKRSFTHCNAEVDADLPALAEIVDSDELPQCGKENAGRLSRCCRNVLLRYRDEGAGDGPRYISAVSAEKAANELLRILREDTPSPAATEIVNGSADAGADTAISEEFDVSFAKQSAKASAGSSIASLPENVLLFRGTPQEKEQAMRFAAEKGLACHTDVLFFREENGACYAVRHVYSTHLEGWFPAAGSVCILSPSAPEALQEQAKTPEQVQAADSDDALPPLQPSDASCFSLPLQAAATLLRETPLEQKEDISAARIVLLAGKGLQKKENFKRLEALASKLGAACGCTRPVAMAGWTSYDKVVGLSGATLQADICIAFGVSGAAPLMAGASGAARFIAVNNDPKAPIFSRCSDGLVADCLEILQAMESLASAPEDPNAHISEEEQQWHT